VTESRHRDTAEILFMLDQRLASVLNVNSDEEFSMEINDGCDLAVLYVAKNGDVTMSAGNTNVFVCDGKDVVRYRGQSIFIGEGKIKSKDEVVVHKIPANKENIYYIASDGMSDQIGGERGRQYGYRVFKNIIIENHHEKQRVISKKIWKAFEKYQGEYSRRDDFQVISFKP
jgi:serine phosphatase RsbU (regulator of sigma subunit)